MELYTLKILLFKILLFNRNLVFCHEKFNIPQANNNTLVNPDDTKLVKPNCSYIEIDGSEPLTRRFVYEIDNAQPNNLSFPNKIDKILFNNYTFVFDENVKLPNVNPDYISIYTCKHNVPVLMYFYIRSKLYYYSLDTRTNKWNNHEIRYATRFIRHTDGHTTPYYTLPDGISFTSTDRFEHKEIVKRFCVPKRCSTVIPYAQTNIQIFVSTPTTSKIVNYTPPTQSISSRDDNTKITEITPTKVTLNNELVYTFYITPLTKRFVYKIYGSHQTKLIYPNKLDKITFNNYTLQLGQNATMPKFHADYLSLYTCEHFIPFLMVLYADTKYYFYSLDIKTNKWSNYTLKYDTRFTKYTDFNGTAYYTMYDDETYSTTDKHEDKELVKLMCKREKCAKVNNPNYSSIELYINQVETPQVTNTGSPKKTQVTRNGNVNTTKPKPNPSSPKAITYPTQEISKAIQTNVYDYRIEAPLRQKLIYPNMIDKIFFNNYVIQFGNDAILPNVNTDSIYIYTCKHNTPLLLLMYGDSKYYYYSMDSKSNKWINHTIKYHTGLEENVDPNGVLYYNVSFKPLPPSTNFLFEDKELAKTFCKAKKCAQLDVDRQKNLEIEFRSK